MSAFVCSDQQILTIVYSAYKGQLILHDTLINEANVLLAENYRSVNHRYKEETPQSFKIEPFSLEDTTSFVVDIVQALKLLQSYEYQACECPDWETTAAYKLAQQLKDKLISRLPGWDNVKWSV